MHDECRTGICGGICTRVCTDTDPCPEGFECLLAGEVNACFARSDAPPPRDGGGCTATDAPALPAVAGILFAIALLSRRKRRG
jgi:MYXO-CTERM domain-containing protein